MYDRYAGFRSDWSLHPTENQAGKARWQARGWEEPRRPMQVCARIVCPHSQDVSRLSPHFRPFVSRQEMRETPRAQQNENKDMFDGFALLGMTIDSCIIEVSARLSSGRLHIEPCLGRKSFLTESYESAQIDPGCSRHSPAPSTETQNSMYNRLCRLGWVE